MPRRRAIPGRGLTLGRRRISGRAARAARGVRALGFALALTLVAPAAGSAQAPSEPSVDGVRAALLEAQDAHLWRVAGWGGASLLAGLGLLVATRGGDHPGWQGFGIQSAAWGAINLGIVAVAQASEPDIGPGLSGLLAAEDGYGNLLLVNLGLNVGYVAVGTALAVAAGHGLRSGTAVRGHGLGVVVQGLGLLVLDGVAWAGSRSRMEAIRSLVDAADLAAGTTPGSVAVTLLSVPL